MPPRPAEATDGIPAGIVVTGAAVSGAAVAQLCAANRTGVLAAGTSPAQLGGTDKPPIEDAWPTPANTGAAPTPAAPPTPPPAPTGSTIPARSAKPPSAPSAASAGKAVRRPPPAIPIRSELADAQLPTWMFAKLASGLLSGELPSVCARLSRMSPSPVGCAAACAAAGDAPASELSPDKGVEAAATWLAASVSPYEPALVPRRFTNCWWMAWAWALAVW